VSASNPPVSAKNADHRTSAGTLSAMAAVVLQGPANTAPARIIGPFATTDEATTWARDHPRPDGYSVAQELTPPDAYGDD
jgi:hypothetical protein